MKVLRLLVLVLVVAAGLVVAARPAAASHAPGHVVAGPVAFGPCTFTGGQFNAWGDCGGASLSFDGRTIVGQGLWNATSGQAHIGGRVTGTGSTSRDVCVKGTNGTMYGAGNTLPGSHTGTYTIQLNTASSQASAAGIFTGAAYFWVQVDGNATCVDPGPPSTCQLLTVHPVSITPRIDFLDEATRTVDFSVRVEGAEPEPPVGETVTQWSVEFGYDVLEPDPAAADDGIGGLIEGTRQRWSYPDPGRYTVTFRTTYLVTGATDVGWDLSGDVPPGDDCSPVSRAIECTMPLDFLRPQDTEGATCVLDSDGDGQVDDDTNPSKDEDPCSSWLTWNLAKAIFNGLKCLFIPPDGFPLAELRADAEAGLFAIPVGGLVAIKSSFENMDYWYDATKVSAENANCLGYRLAIPLGPLFAEDGSDDDAVFHPFDTCPGTIGAQVAPWLRMLSLAGLYLTAALAISGVWMKALFGLHIGNTKSDGGEPEQGPNSLQGRQARQQSKNLRGGRK